jgi:hypothetical protein
MCSGQGNVPDVHASLGHSGQKGLGPCVHGTASGLPRTLSAQSLGSIEGGSFNVECTVNVTTLPALQGWPRTHIKERGPVLFRET